MDKAYGFLSICVVVVLLVLAAGITPAIISLEWTDAWVAKESAPHVVRAVKANADKAEFDADKAEADAALAWTQARIAELDYQLKAMVVGLGGLGVVLVFWLLVPAIGSAIGWYRLRNKQIPEDERVAAIVTHGAVFGFVGGATISFFVPAIALLLVLPPVLVVGGAIIVMVFRRRPQVQR